jgi:hypothetical protein
MYPIVHRYAPADRAGGALRTSSASVYAEFARAASVGACMPWDSSSTLMAVLAGESVGPIRWFASEQELWWLAPLSQAQVAGRALIGW